MRFYTTFKRTASGGTGLPAVAAPTAPPGLPATFNSGNILACNFTDARNWPVHRIAVAYKGPASSIPLPVDLYIWVENLGSDGVGGDGAGAWVQVNHSKKYLESGKITYFDIVGVPAQSLYSKDQNATFGSIEAVLVFDAEASAPNGDHFFAMTPDLTTIGEDTPNIPNWGRRVRAVTPNSGADLPDGPCEVIVCLADGDLAFVAAGDLTAEVHTWPLTVGDVVQVPIRRVMATTTATVEAIYP